MFLRETGRGEVGRGVNGDWVVVLVMGVGRMGFVMEAGGSCISRGALFMEDGEDTSRR